MTSRGTTDRRPAAPGRRTPDAVPARGSGAGLLALALGAGAAGALLGARALAVAPTALGAGARVETWVELGAVTAGGLAAWWVALGATLGLAVVVAARRGVRWRAGEAAVRRVAPGLVRRLARVGVGVGVGAGLVLAPTTATAAGPAPDPGPGTPAVAVDLGWQPTAPGTGGPASTAEPAPPATEPPATEPPGAEPPGAEQPGPEQPGAEQPGAATASEVRRESAHPGPAPDGSVVVHRGDTLWGIAARWLGGSPTDAEVLAATVRWHETNREVVGDDPDLVLPGQVLRPPA
ncbi:LysM peptidoglycan-binding domain-containing protein [Puerhibacterium sp. TATVAM-FAB25]|uniref:LysM peptidoglycan-binding domain-containing protein n=1 Tax=Puerhibacterium sp. TATVAM-FAB25 TaxID=3093699 RepID=UPI00397C69C6